MTYTVIDIETTGSEPWRHDLVAVGIGSDVHRPERGRRLARQVLASPGVVVAHTNYDLRWLMLDGATLHPDLEYHDTKVMAWILGAKSGAMSLEDLAVEHLGYRPPKLLKQRAGRVMFDSPTVGLVPIEDAPWPEMVYYNGSDIETTGRLYEALRTKLQDKGLWDYFLTEEAPFSKVLVEMEAHGIPFDPVRAAELLAKVDDRLDETRARLIDWVGCPEFNPASGDQVAAYLYDETWGLPGSIPIPRMNGVPKDVKLDAVRGLVPKGFKVTSVGRDYAHGEYVLDGRGLKPPKAKAKKGEAPKKRPTVAAKVLNQAYPKDPWVQAYCGFQKDQKLAGYLRGWIDKEHDGRIHGRFDQSGTDTGRLAGRDPNLQQVDHSPAIRGLFHGAMIVGDYAGLEARLGAHFSGDPVMLDVFRSGKDLYGVLAAQAWGGPETKANEGRSLMKVLWLASQYGAQGDTLSTQMRQAGLDYGPRKADALLRDLQFAVPRLFEWRDEVIAEARSLGYVMTLAGRRRYLPDLDSSDWWRMAQAERQAVNSRVQGSAADLVRRAMLAARRAVPPEVARICLQVHDEIIWQPGPEWSDGVFGVLVDACEHGHGFELLAPITFECAIVQSWAEKT